MYPLTANSRLQLVVFACILLAFVLHQHHHQVEGICDNLWNVRALKSNQACKSNELQNAYQNLPILNAVYCFNNGTGLCKALAGRFEFYLNSWTGEVLGPVEESRWVDANGYHFERVPISYMVNGNVLYADRPINWAIDFIKSQPDVKFNLLMSTSFNWCKYATTNNWPYKSAIRDHNENITIFFFNRQSCVYNKASSELQHFNTRFMGNSQLRIDLDYNPTIFAMEDDLAKEVRLVKNHRQHWYEVAWKTQVNPTNKIRYFVQMDPEEKTPCRINMTSPRLIQASGYKKFVGNGCISDYFTTRTMQANSRLVDSHCGLDRIEIADYLPLDKNPDKMYEVGLHNIPRWPERVQKFYGVSVTDANMWERFAQDGFSFSATTTIQITDATYRVISLFSQYKTQSPSNNFDEHYPVTYLADYYVQQAGGWYPSMRSSRMTEMRNLNYVDDIAYLHTCKTILVIHGPLYTEFKPDEFNNVTKTYLGSINDLGAYEPVSAFFAKDEDKLYLYHRLNYVSEHRYTCAHGSNRLVTATATDKYFYRHGKTSLPWMQLDTSIKDLDVSEETSFYQLGVLSREPSADAAPDPTRYEWDREEETNLATKGMPTWIWLLVVIGLLALLILFTLGFITFRRKIRRRQLLQTVRSEMPDSGIGESDPTHRSALSKSERSGGRSTVRSGAISRGQTVGGTVRSARLSRAPNKATLRSGVASQDKSLSGSSRSRARLSQSSGMKRPGTSQASTVRSSATPTLASRR